MWHRIGKQGGKYWGKRGAGIIFTDGSSILLLRRSGETDHKGKWGCPGGKAEEGETLIGTAQRETREEIGHLPKTIRKIDHIDTEDGKHRFRTYLCKVPSQFECKLSKEHDDYDWFPFDDVRNLELHPKLDNIISDIISILKRSHKDLKEMSGFAEFVSMCEMGVVAGTNPPTPPAHSDWNFQGAPGRTAVSPKEGPIKSWIKKKKKKKKKHR